jgi:glycosyltransferase involved in cell wall biosynthesis
MIESGNVQEWAKAIIWMLSNSEVAKQMAKAGKQVVIEKFSLNANTNSLIDLVVKN